MWKTTKTPEELKKLINRKSNSTKKTGDLIEKLAGALLVEWGYVVESPNYTRFGDSDFFGLWDLIAINDEHVRLVQTSTKYRSGRNKDYTKFPKPEGLVTEYWRYDKKRQLFKIEKL